MVLTGISFKAKAIDYVREGRINLPTSNCLKANTIWHCYQNVAVHLSTADKYHWVSNKKQHAISTVYNNLAKHGTAIRFSWYKRVWNSTTSEKLNYGLWKILRNAIHTTSSLLIRGISVDDICTFCKAHPEDIKHLYFQCPEISLLWKKTEA